MKALVIAEKPSVARDIARVLKCGKKINGAIEGERYIVTWGLGHLVTLADPEDYDKKYKEWKIDVLPMKPAPFKLEVIKQTGKQFAAVKTQIHRKDVNEIIIATDAGREGELVARLILEKAGSKKPIKRLWISSVTDKAIREGFAKLKNGHEYDALYDAAMCRAEADWLVGINATRALTCKYNAQLSCGRVQTPTLAMIAKREEKIRSFIPEGYYGMTAKGQNIMLTWQDQKSKSYRSFDKEKMTGLMKKLDGQKAVVEEIKKTPKKTYALLLYDLTELQREANQRFGWISVFILSAQYVILLCKFNSELSVNGEVHAKFIRLRVKPNDYGISKTFAAQQPICIGMLAQIFNSGYKSRIHSITSNRLTNSL